MDIFGVWKHNLNKLHSIYKNNIPFPHITIDNFFDETFANELVKSFPNRNDKNWIKYWNPIEKKYALNKFDTNLPYTNLFHVLQSPDFLDYMKILTDIPNLETDPHLHGAGIHMHPNGGKLDMHLDYSIHPITKKQRRLNLIIYLNKEWKESYGGELQLWDKDFIEPKQRIFPKFNRAVLFQTNDISYHGLPQMIQCPEEESRKSIAIYYVSDPTSSNNIRYKANFRPLPSQKINKQLENLYKIRNTQTLTDDILNEVYPNWELDGNGHW